MEQIKPEELKKIAFEVLCRVRDVCVSLGLRYFLDGGTLLGAIRHKGYIPWDDDIDICMPRPDYDKFIEYCKNNKTSFGLVSNEIDKRFTELYAKAYALRTVCKERYVNRSDVEYGVYIDIFPVDGLGKTTEDALKLLHKSRYKRSLLTAANWQKYFKSRTRKWYIEPIRFVFYLLSRCTNRNKLIEKIKKIYQGTDFDSSEKVGVVCGCYGDREVMDRSLYDRSTDVVFENETFTAMAEYDKFLTNLYGDYIQLPPEEKRVTHHTFDAFRL